MGSLAVKVNHWGKFKEKLELLSLMNQREDARQDKLKLVLIKEYLVYRTLQLQLCNFFSIQIQHNWCWRFTWTQILLLHLISFLQILWWSWELHLTIGGGTLTAEQHVIWLQAINFQIFHMIWDIVIYQNLPNIFQWATHFNTNNVTRKSHIENFAY